jgi:hypothetical protein
VRAMRSPILSGRLGTVAHEKDILCFLSMRRRLSSHIELSGYLSLRVPVHFLRKV